MNYPPICDQSFSVRDESGSPIDNAEVIAEKSVQTGFWRVTSTTTSDGGAVLTLDEGDTYTATAVKDGYECVSCTKTFNPCIGRITFTLRKKMGEAKACDIFRFPQSNVVLDEGDDLFIKLSVNNCGTTLGNFYYEIFLDGHRCDSRHNVWLEPGQNSYDVLRCDLVMGKNVKTFIQAGGHAEGGNWVEDFRYTHTITPRTYTLIISPTTHNSPVNGDTFSINVTSNTTWSVSEYKSWIRCTPSSGNGNDIISVTVDANTSTSSRIGTIHVTHDGMTRNCVITQPGATPPPYLTITPTAHSSPANGDSFSITIRTNVFWTVTEPSWMNSKPFTGTGNDTTTITVAANTSEASRTGTISVCAPGNGITRTCSVTQLGVVCTCGDWIDGECVSTTHRCQTRTCTPAGCDIEYQEVLDQTCETAPLCSDYTDEESCILAGCFWYDGFCHEYAPGRCSDYTDALTCEANLCHWWSDGTCHDIEEPSPDKKKTEFCGFGIYDEENSQRTLIINKQYTVAAKLCWVKLLGIGGCNLIHPSDCVEGYEVPDVKLQFKKADGTEILETPVTNAEGWAGAIWTPTELDIGIYNVKLIFPGDANYNACESNEVGIEVKEPSVGLHIKSCTPTEFPNALYSGINPLSIETVVYNDTTETVEVKLKLTFIEGAKLCDEIPELHFKNIGAGESWTEHLTLPTIRCIATYLEDMWARVELWEQYEGERTDSVDIKIGNPPEPNGEEGLFASLILMIMDSFNLSEPQAKLLVYGAGGLLALSFIMPMLRR